MGNSTKYEYDTMNRIIKETDALGRVKNYAYDALGRLTSESDKRGYVKSYEYDAAGNLIKLTDAMGASIDYSYDKLYRISSIKDRMGAVSEYTYDKNSNIESIKEANGNTRRFIYDRNDNIIYEESGGIGSKKEYDIYGNVIYEESLGLASCEYDALGNMISKTDLLNNKTRYERDGLGRISVIEDARGARTGFLYNAYSQIAEIEYPDKSKKIFTYDKAGELISETYGEGNKKEYERDALGRIISETSLGLGTKRYAYDSVGNLISIEDEFGNVSRMEYNEEGMPIVKYDANGTPTYYEYDALGNMIKFGYVNDSAKLQNKNQAGVILNKDTNIVYSYAYDKEGRLVSETDPFLRTKVMEYDSVGNLMTVKDKAGDKTKFTYDLRGNLKSVLYPDGESEYYLYDEHDLITDYGNSRHRGSIKRDLLGRIQKVDTGSASTEYKYDENGNLSFIGNFGDETSVRYRYDSMNRIRDIYIGGTAKEKANLNGSFCYEYDLSGNIIKEVKANGEVEKREYTKNGRLSKIYIGDKLTASYEYDNRGDVIRQSESFGGKNILKSFEYGKDSKLLKEIVSIEGEISYCTTYIYDKIGNMLVEERKGENDNLIYTIKYNYDKANRLVQKEEISDKTAVYTYEYDENGNLISQRTNGNRTASYVIDGKGQLVGALTTKGEVTYSYDALDHVIRKAVDGKVTNYVPSHISDIDIAIKEFGQDEMNHVYGPLGKVCMYSGQQIYCNYKDRLGSIREIRDVNSNLVSGFTYDTWGNVAGTYITDGIKRYADNPLETAAYTGHRYESIIDAYYANARYYCAANKRFMSEDPIRYGDNWYIYANDNPVRYVDRDGKHPGIIIGAAAGAVTGLVSSTASELMDVYLWKTKDSINFKDIAIDTVIGAGTGAIAGTGVGAVGIISSSVAAGGLTYVAKTTVNNEWKDKSMKEHIIDGSVSAAVSGVLAGVSLRIGGTMEKTVDDFNSIINRDLMEGVGGLPRLRYNIIKQAKDYKKLINLTIKNQRRDTAYITGAYFAGGELIKLINILRKNPKEWYESTDRSVRKALSHVNDNYYGYFARWK